MIYNLLGDWVFTFVYYLMTFLGTLLLIISIAYIFFVYKNIKENNWIKKRKPYWERLLRDYQYGNIQKDLLIKKLENKNEFLRDYLIEQTRKEEFDREILRDVYIECGYVLEDIENIDSKKWYDKAQIYAVWKHLRILPMNSYIIDELLSENNEIRLATLDLLTILRHPVLKDKLEDIFSFYSEHVDYYLNVKLMAAEIPIEDLEYLIQSENPRLKKTGVILLGREGETESIDILKRLEHEPEDIRCEVIKAVGRIRSIEGIDVLENMKHDDSHIVRNEVAIALGKISYANSLKELQQISTHERVDEIMSILSELANDENQKVRLNAFLALSNLGEKGREKIEEYRDEYPGITKEVLLKSFSGGLNYDTV